MRGAGLGPAQFATDKFTFAFAQKKCNFVQLQRGVFFTYSSELAYLRPSSIPGGFEGNINVVNVDVVP